MVKEKPDCWPPRKAEKVIHAYANGPGLDVSYSDHAQERMAERGIAGVDILYVLAYGHIHNKPEPATRPGYCKYTICAKTPNSGNRTICTVVIPEPGKPAVKIITAMWEDL